MLAVDVAEAQIIVAVITAAAAVIVAVIGVQVKVHRDNRFDHNETAAKVDRLLDNQSGIQRDVQYIRADVSDIHGALTVLRHSDHQADERLTKLERQQRNQEDTP